MEKIRFGKTILIGSLFVLLVVIVDPIRVMVSQGSSLTSDYSTGAAFFYFFLLAILNGIISKINKSASLSGAELIIIYGMMIVGCAIPTWGFTLNLIPLLPGIHYYADPAWKSLVIPYVRSWLTVTDPNAIQWFFEGLPKGVSIPWKAWAVPLSCWMVLIFSVYMLSILLMALFQKRWVEEEKLTYPLAFAPETLAQQTNGFPPVFKSRIFWIGLSIPLLIISLNCLHVYFPSFPSILLTHSISLFRKTAGVDLKIYFEVIGLIYFVPLEVSLGIWFFYLLLVVQGGFFNIIGYTYSSPEPWAFTGLAAGYESMGAMFTMVFLMFWQERSYWKSTIKQKDNYPLFWGSLFFFTVIVVWLTLSGLKFHHSLVFTFLTFITFIGITRVVCQAGTPYARSGAVPAGMTLNIFGTEAIGSRGIAALNFTSPWACDLRTMVMASIATFFRLGHTFKVNLRKIILAGILAVLLGLAGSAWSIIHTAYKYGGINLGGWQFAGFVQYTLGWLKEYFLHPYGFGKFQFSFLGIGSLVYLAFFFLRVRFPMFPIHPLGLTIASTIPIIFTWFSIFIGWFLKALILKYGGPKVYKNLQPFFLGLILGSFLAGGLWMIIDFITGIIPATQPIMGG